MDPLGWFLRMGFGFMVRRALRGVWVRGDLPTGGFVWASNHHGWWDAFVAAAVLWRHGLQVTVLMDGGNLRRFSFLRRVGVRGATELRAAVADLRAGRVVILFPEGGMQPPGPLAPLRPGAGWLARRADVPLVAVATRVVLRGQQAPEAYLDLRGAAPDGLEPVLAGALHDLDQALRRHDPRRPLPGFRVVVPGWRISWDERLRRERPV